MLAYTLPRPSFDALVEFMGKDRAEKFVGSVEAAINDQRGEIQQQLEAARKEQKTVIKEELRNELITRDVFEERFKSLEARTEERFKSLEARTEERFKRLDLKLNIFLALAFVSLTFANPTFTELVKHVFK